MDSNIFPLSFHKHILFCIVATLFFLLQFFRTKRWYQLVMAIAVPLTLLIYIDEKSSTLFYGVGIAEGVLLLAALVLNIVQSRHIRAAEAERAPSNTAETETAPENTPETKAAPSDTAETGAAPENTPEAETAPSNTAETEAAPENTPETDTAPSDTAETETAPEDTAETEAQPEE